MRIQGVNKVGKLILRQLLCEGPVQFIEWQFGWVYEIVSGRPTDRATKCLSREFISSSECHPSQPGDQPRRKRRRRRSPSLDLIRLGASLKKFISLVLYRTMTNPIGTAQPACLAVRCIFCGFRKRHRNRRRISVPNQFVCLFVACGKVAGW